jgi:hypothetical protein
MRRTASWRSGYAEDCKSLYGGSIPSEASNREIIYGDDRPARRRWQLLLGSPFRVGGGLAHSPIGLIIATADANAARGGRRAGHGRGFELGAPSLRSKPMSVNAARMSGKGSAARSLFPLRRCCYPFRTGPDVALPRHFRPCRRRGPSLRQRPDRANWTPGPIAGSRTRTSAHGD